MLPIRVISANPLTEEQKKRVRKVFDKKHAGKQAEYSFEIDEAVLGGLLIIDGDKYYDGTVLGQMSKLVVSAIDPKATASIKHAVKSKKNKAATKKEGAESREVSDLIAGKSSGLDKTTSEFVEGLQKFKNNYDMQYAGQVTFSGDGVVHIDGLSGAKYGEMLTLSDTLQAIVLSLQEKDVGAIVLDDDDKVAAHMIAKSTGMIVSVPVGESLLGRVLSPLGMPIDGKGAIKSDKVRPIEFGAPAIKDRGKVCVPMQTGILAIDSMIPIGRGQRELIIGDRQTGKTSIAVDTILNQRNSGVICIYVAIGQKASSVAGLVKTLSDNGAMANTVVICATARDSAPLQYIAPYAGCAIAEEFMYSGKDVLIVYDDLSKHAVAYRAMSLLLKRPPGREAYPGDIFYLHSRLLERAAKLSDELGGGSMTALPIVETLAGDISAYIPTNIISITDGQIYLESDLFNSGVRPAINVGLSVSRVGSSAQLKPMRKLSGTLRIGLSQYRELSTFAQFGADLDEQTRRQLEQGKRTTEILKQDIHSPLDIGHQILILYVTVKEMLRKIPVNYVQQFKDEFLKYFDIKYPQVIDALKNGSDINVEIGLTIDEAVDEFSEYFLKEHVPHDKAAI